MKFFEYIKCNECKIKNILFQTGMCILFAQVYLIGSTIPLPEIRLTLPAFVLILISAFFSLNYSYRQITASAIIMVLGAYTAISTKNNNALWIAILLTFSRGIDIKSLMKKMLIILTTVYVIAMLLAFIGIIPDLTRDTAAGADLIKHSMGINDANGNHAFFLIIISLIIALYYEKLKLWHYSVMFILNYFIYRITICRTAAAIIAMEIVGAYIIKSFLDKEKLKKYLQYMMLMADVSMIILICILIFAAYRFDWQISWMTKLNNFITGRLWLGHDFFQRYPVKLFGNYMPDIVGQTAVLDIGYYVLLLQYGPIFTVFYIAANVFLLHRFRVKEQYGQYIAVIASLLYLSTENMLISYAFYNFTYFWISDLLFGKNCNYEKIKEKSERYFVRVNMLKANNAGFKAVRDCESILKKNGFSAYNLYIRVTRYKFINQLIDYSIKAKLRHIPAESIVVISYPLYNINFDYLNELYKVKNKKNLKLIFLIHDLQSLRERSTIYEIYDKEMFNCADYIIAHNDKMKKYILENSNISDERVVVLGLFDYLCNINNQITDTENKNEVIVAGNLDSEKAGYIKYLPGIRDISFQLYGGGYREHGNDNIKYHGSFEPDELPGKLNGDFGLVWDGNSENTCSGNNGEYLRYNNPHKTSLYLAAGIPVITWKYAAIADFITDSKAGITIKNLYEIPKYINKLTDKEYNELKYNASRIGEKIRNGYFLNRALRQILGKIFIED